MHLPVLGVTHGHLAAGDCAPPFTEPIRGTAAVTAPGPPAAFLIVVGRAAGGPADPAALRRAAGGPAGRPILPVDARLQKESVDASDANDAVSDDGGRGWCAVPFVLPPPPPRRSTSSCRRSSKDGTPAGSLFFAAFSSVVSWHEAGRDNDTSLSGFSLPLPAGPGG
jgi:hypothetical protein